MKNLIQLIRTYNIHTFFSIDGYDENVYDVTAGTGDGGGGVEYCPRRAERLSERERLHHRRRTWYSTNNGEFSEGVLRYVQGRGRVQELDISLQY